MDDKFELDLIHDEIDFLEEENITESEMKMQRRKTLYDVSIVVRILVLSTLHEQHPDWLS